MSEIPIITYTHASGDTFEIFDMNSTITWGMPGKEVIHHDDKMGQSIDLNRGYRTIDCSRRIQGHHATEDCLANLHAYVMPSTAPDYIAYTAVGGAVIVDATVSEVDQTTEANSAAANDMCLSTCAPLNMAVGDYYAFGSASPIAGIKLNIGTAGVGVWTLVLEYSRGSDVWGALQGVVDGTNHFMTVGTNTMTWTIPPDWETDEVGGISDLYWVRARYSVVTNQTTRPLGTQAWLWGLYPYVRVMLDSANYWTMGCMMTALKATHNVDNIWNAAITLTERTY